MPPLAAAAGAATGAVAAAKGVALAGKAIGGLAKAGAIGAGQQLATGANALQLTAKANLGGTAATGQMAKAAAGQTAGGKVGATLANLGTGAMGSGPYALPMEGLAMLGGGGSSPATPAPVGSSEATPYTSRPKPMPGMIQDGDGGQRMKRFNDYFQEAMQQK